MFDESSHYSLNYSIHSLMHLPTIVFVIAIICGYCHSPSCTSKRGNEPNEDLVTQQNNLETSHTNILSLKEFMLSVVEYRKY